MNHDAPERTGQPESDFGLRGESSQRVPETPRSEDSGLCSEIEEAAAEVLFGNPTVSERALVAEHIEDCSECRSALRGFEAVMHFSQNRPQADPGEEFWESFHDRVVERALSQATRNVELDQLTEQPGHRAGGPLNLGPLPSGGLFTLLNTGQARQWAFRAVAAVVLVAVGISIGRLTFGFGGGADDTARGSDTVVGAITEQDATPSRIVPVDTGAGDLLARSEIVLLQFVNDSGSEQSATLARELGHRAEVVKASLDDAGQRSMAELVRELEFVLLQIANLDATDDASGVELVRDAIDQRALLFRINRQQLRDTPVRDRSGATPAQQL